MVSVLTIIHVVFLLTLAILLYRRQPAMRKFYWPALVIRLIGGICLGLVYTYYYTVADTFTYFHDTSALARLAREDISAYLTFLFRGNDLPIPLDLADPFSDPR